MVQDLSTFSGTQKLVCLVQDLCFNLNFEFICMPLFMMVNKEGKTLIRSGRNSLTS
jgi:hypothetical protein